MPAPLIKKAAKQSGKSTKKVDSYWKQAKKSASEKGLKPGSPSFYKYVTAIVKKRTGYEPKKENLDEMLADLPDDPTIPGFDLFRDIGEAAYRAICHDLYTNMDRVPEMISAGLISGIEEAVDFPSNLTSQQKRKVRVWLLRSVAKHLYRYSRV